MTKRKQLRDTEQQCLMQDAWPTAPVEGRPGGRVLDPRLELVILARLL
jgi:hypothetical protein